MKKLSFLAFAAIVALASCSGNTSSDNYVDSTSVGDSTKDSMHVDSSAPKDTVYPKTDTTSYRKDKDTAKKTAQ